MTARTGVRLARTRTSPSAALPNGVRLSCAAVLCFSQMQFYYDGRRQLQPHVRQMRLDLNPSIPCSCQPRD